MVGGMSIVDSCISSARRCSSVRVNQTTLPGRVLFLIADAPYITGQIIAVDGGRSVNL